MLYYGFPGPQVPACSAKVSLWHEPLLHLMDQITFSVFSHTTEQNSQPTTFLISKQAVPYRTHGSTCYPKGSTPKYRSLANSSKTIHKPWRSQPSPPFQTLLKPQHWTSPLSPHIMTDGRPILSTVTQAKLNIIKMEWLVRWLKTVGLSNTTNHKNSILKYEGWGNQLMHASCES
jgi:hypothetical protein